MTQRMITGTVLSAAVAAVMVIPSAAAGQHAIPGWEISAPFPAAQLEIAEIDYPNFFSLYMMQWKQVEGGPVGLIDVSSHVTRAGDAPIAVVARTTVYLDENQYLPFRLEYSGEVVLFINKTPQIRAAADTGSAGSPAIREAHAVLTHGLTEILLVMKSSTDPWQVRVQTDRIFSALPNDHARLVPVWETPEEFMIPESVLHDPDRDLLYVSSYNRVQASGAGRGFISRVGIDGEILDLRWVEGLDGPCGMGLHEDRLYVVECVGNLVEIDAGTGVILNRWQAPDARFLNDLVIDSDGTIYISDTSPPLGYTSVIYRFRDGRFEVWKGGGVDAKEIMVHRANGLYIHDGELLVGSSGDCLFKAFDLETKEGRSIVALGGRVIDGIRVDREGNYLVTLWEGEAVLISPEGDLLEILDIRGSGRNLADMEFIRDLDLLVVPTFLGNTVAAYRLVRN